MYPFTFARICTPDYLLYFGIQTYHSNSKDVGYGYQSKEDNTGRFGIEHGTDNTKTGF